MSFAAEDAAPGVVAQTSVCTPVQAEARTIRLRRAFTLLEMLTTVAALVIVLGLMVSLARLVRTRSADNLTRDLLLRLDEAVSQQSGIQATLRAIPRLVSGPYDDSAIQRNALENSRAFVRVWNEATNGRVLRDQPASIYDQSTLRDAWGTPIAFMPPGATNIGIAPQSRFFFMSAGPDRKFTTLLDNLYSYEGGSRRLSATTRPTGENGGQRE